MSLVAVTLPDIGDCICAHGWLIVALGMSSMGQCPVAWMISTYPIMEFCQYILSLLVSKALKVGLVQGPFILLTIHEGEPSRLDLDLVCFSSIIRKFSQAQIVDYWSHHRRTRFVYFVYLVGSNRRLWLVVDQEEHNFFYW